MDGKTRLGIRQFSIQAGQRQAEPSNIRVVDVAGERRVSRSRRSRGSLCVLVETHRDGPGVDLSPAMQSSLLTAIEKTYYRTSGSVTRGLREAILAANDLLLEQALRADSEHYAIVGIACAILRDSDVYIGQIGPSLVALARQGSLTRYPAESAWFHSGFPEPLEFNREPPAGTRRDAEPDLYHLALSPGDTLVISATSLAVKASDQAIIDALGGESDAAVTAKLEALTAGYDVSAVVIQYPRTSEPAQYVAPGPTHSAASAAGVVASSRKPAVTAAPSPAVTGPAMSASASRRSAPTSSAGTGSSRSETGGDESPWAGDEKASAARAQDGARGDLQADPLEQTRMDLDALRTGLREQAGKLREGTQGFLLNVLPQTLPEPPPERERMSQSISMGGRALVVVAMALPLVVLFLVVMARVQYERMRLTQFDEIVRLAQERYGAALQMDNETIMRQELYDAQEVVEEGLSIDPGDETLNSLHRQIQHKLDEISNVERLYHFWQLAQLDEDPTSPTDSSRIVIHDKDLFLLNRGSDRVYRFLLNNVGDALQPVEGDSILVRKGELRGSVKLGDLVDIAWLEEGEERKVSTFVILERGGTLLAYNPQQGIDVLPVANSDQWLKPQAIGGYTGNLYVLDPLLGQILKYVPLDNAYVQPPESYLSPHPELDLTGAVDMAIDGNMYVLYADGRIDKFFRGEKQPFSLDGLPTPMRSPTTIFVAGPQRPDAEGYVYVTDTGNERILQFSKDGRYIRQLLDQPGEIRLRGLRGIYVDEADGRIFVLSGRTLWLTQLPPLQNPPS